MNMTNDFFKELNEKFSKFDANFTPILELQKMMSEHFTRTTSFNVRKTQEALKSYTDSLNQLSGIKKAEDLTNFCRDISKESSEKALAHTKESLEHFLDASNQYAKWLEKNIKNKVDLTEISALRTKETTKA